MKYATLFTLLGATSALAHPGHQAPVADGAVHWLVQGGHLAVIVLGVALIWALLKLRPQDMLRRFLTRE